MPSSQLCQNVRQSLEPIRSLKEQLDKAFEKAFSSDNQEDMISAQKLKQEFKQHIKVLQKTVDISIQDVFQKSQKEILDLIEEKMNSGKLLTRNELAFLYEDWPSSPDTTFNSWQKRDLLAQRNHEKDLYTLFDYFEVALHSDQITPETKVYVGPLEPGIFQRLPDTIEAVYTSFPGERIRFHSIEIGGKDEQELEKRLKQDGHQVNQFAKTMMEYDDFKRSLRQPDPNDPDQPDWTKWNLKPPEEAKLVRLRVKSLGFPNGATMDQIYDRAIELGLELCPPEVGPQLCLHDPNQPMDYNAEVGMEPIHYSGSYYIFTVAGSRLSYNWIEKWEANHEFIFRLPKKPSLS